MPSIMSSDEVRPIALATAERGRSSRFGYLGSYFRDLEVGSVLMLDENDLSNYSQDVARIVASCDDGVTLSKDDRAKMRNMLSALIREMRKVLGETADLRSVYHFDGDVPAYGVKRVA